MIRKIERLLILVALAVSLKASAEGPKTPFRLAISPINADVKLGADVSIRIVITNTSNDKVSCTSAYASGVDRSYRYVIQDENGRILNKKLKKHPELGDSISVQLCSLQPGESNTTESLIGQDYDMKHPGKYVVQIVRSTSDRDVTPPVLSNKSNNCYRGPQISREDYRPGAPIYCAARRPAAVLGTGELWAALRAPVAVSNWKAAVPVLVETKR
jgi:hypothetical protein